MPPPRAACFFVFVKLGCEFEILTLGSNLLGMREVSLRFAAGEG